MLCYLPIMGCFPFLCYLVHLHHSMLLYTWFPLVEMPFFTFWNYFFFFFFYSTSNVTSAVNCWTAICTAVLNFIPLSNNFPLPKGYNLSFAIWPYFSTVICLQVHLSLFFYRYHWLQETAQPFLFSSAISHSLILWQPWASQWHVPQNLHLSEIIHNYKIR